MSPEGIAGIVVINIDSCSIQRSFIGQKQAVIAKLLQ
jgi:hypothetical protein